MKKAISIVLHILSIILTAITLTFIAFCCYDWIRYAEFTFIFDFWWVMDINAICMMVSSAVGLAVTIPNIFVSTNQNIKKFAKIMTVAFSLVIILSLILYAQPIDLNLPIDSLF